MRLLLLIFLTILTLHGESDFVGLGYGKTLQEAKQTALADLSSQLKVEVYSQSTLSLKVKNTKISNTSSSHIETTSRLPIIGAQFKILNTSNQEYQLQVTLSASVSKEAYKKELERCLFSIEKLNSSLKKSSDSASQEELLTLLLNELNEYDRYYSVALILGVKNIKNIPISKAEIQMKILKLYSNIESIELATKLLARNFQNFKNIYVYPPKHSQSHEITQFAKNIKITLESKLQTSVPQVNQAKYLLVGKYIESNNGILLSYQLLDSLKQEQVSSKSIILKPKSYKNLITKPKTIAFDKLLYSGVILSNNLQVTLTTNKGSEDLLFTSGEEIKILVKLNRMGYFYIVGYTYFEGKKQAYLLDFEDTQGIGKFIKFVNADDANKWVELGTFSVEAPFGIESIQVIASNKKITTVPEYLYDEESGYYLLVTGVEDSVVATRGLKRKKSKKRFVAEDVLRFTTMN